MLDASDAVELKSDYASSEHGRRNGGWVSYVLHFPLPSLHHRRSPLPIIAHDRLTLKAKVQGATRAAACLPLLPTSFVDRFQGPWRSTKSPSIRSMPPYLGILYYRASVKCDISSAARCLLWIC
jgi:hypothetical protein